MNEDDNRQTREMTGVLLASSRDWLASSMRAVLEPEGYGFRNSTTAVAALHDASVHTPGIVIIDESIADSSVPDLCTDLLEEGLTRSVPILVYSQTFWNESEQTAAMLAGAWDVIREPLRSGLLLAKLQRLMQVRRLIEASDREAIGDVLAKGIAATAQYFRHPEIGMHVKGQGLPAYDPRGLKGMGIAYATSNRGACHLRAYTPASELGLISGKTDPLEWKGKGELTKLFQDLHAFSDSMDLCKFSAFAMGAEEYAAQYSAMVGVPFTQEDVLTTGERIYNLERHYNNLAGFGEGSDTLPARYTSEPSKMKGSDGHVCELEGMLDEYYAARGWKNGVVPESKLTELQVL